MYQEQTKNPSVSLYHTDDGNPSTQSHFILMCLYSILSQDFTCTPIYSLTCLWKFLSSVRQKYFSNFLYIHLLAQNLAQSSWLHGFIKPKIESEAIKCPSAY